MNKHELMALMANDPDVRRLVVRILRDEQLHSPLITDPTSGIVVVRSQPCGMITYQQAADMAQCQAGYIRTIVHRGAVPGGKDHNGTGWVERRAFIEYVMSKCKERMRGAMVHYLEHEEENSPPTAPAVAPSQKLQQRRTSTLTPTLFAAQLP
jgi:hypothetical protein